jgi:hypothetical protein
MESVLERYPREVQERISNMSFYGTDYYDKKDRIEARHGKIEGLKSMNLDLQDTIAKINTELSRRMTVSPMNYPDNEYLRKSQKKEIAEDMGVMDKFRKRNTIKSLKLHSKIQTKQEDLIRNKEVMDINMCEQLRNICLADPGDCLKMGHDKKLKECHDRTLVFVRTFYKNQNGFEDRYKLDTIPITDMIDILPTNLFTNDFKDKLKRELYEVYNIGNDYFNLPTWDLYSKLIDFTGDGDLVQGVYPVLLNVIFDIFSDPYDSSLKDDKKKVDRIEKMKRYFLLRLMNRDQEASQRYTSYIGNEIYDFNRSRNAAKMTYPHMHLSDLSRPSFNDHLVLWGDSSFEAAEEYENKHIERMLTKYDLDVQTIVNILMGEDDFLPTPYNIFLKNEHKPDGRKKKGKKKGGGYTKKKGGGYTKKKGRGYTKKKKK